MKFRIEVGAVRVDVDGLVLTRRQLLQLVGEVAGVALAVGEQPELPDPPPFGFSLSAQTERAADDEPDLSEFFEDEE